MTTTDIKDFDPLFKASPISFTSAYKVLPQKGNLVYEYNPLRNYRLSKSMFEYNGRLLSLEELKDQGILLYTINKETKEEKEVTDISIIEYGNDQLIWRNKNQELTISESPILRRKGELVDFETSDLKFDIQHPVNILPQYSYDGSVNLVLNDGKNIPRLINSRFSPLGRNKYQIVDRKGDNDTNIYDQGSQFDIDTSLYKRTNLIPKLIYYGTFSSGRMSIGNYHFYFKYMDADENETDFIAESGLVSIFIGTDPYNIQSQFRNADSHKGVSFLLQNIDPGYQYISVYYTVSTSDIFQNPTVQAYKIEQKFLVNSANMCQIKISGFEDKTEISVDQINLAYQVAGSVETQDQCQNMLFLGNIQKPEINYKELQDISLRIVPKIKKEIYNIQDIVNEEYIPQKNYSNSYYNSKFIYNKVGYWPNEIYRFGIVYILKDNTLSSVFNIRGIKDLDENPVFQKYTFESSDQLGNINRNYIAYNEENFLIYSDGGNSINETSRNYLENVKGVVSIKNQDTDARYIYGIQFSFDERENEQGCCLNKLKELEIKGFFFVRQKRLPTTLCEAFTIGVDRESHIPAIPYQEDGKDMQYLVECFLDKDTKLLTHDYLTKLQYLSSSDITTAAICPEYDVNSPYLNTLFSGDKFTIEKISKGTLKRDKYNDRHYYIEKEDFFNQSQNVRIIGVEDNVKLVAIDDIFYSARAGEAEEAFRYEYVKIKNISKDAVNLVRGSFGPYLGINNTSYESSLISIKVPNYNYSNMEDYFNIRYNDKSPYYAIGDRYLLEDFNNNPIYYRGDCYICQFTHRLNRNFQDPSAPVNDKIVDEKCWKNNFEVSDGVVKKENFEKINLGDVNAVQLGSWITIPVRSTFNLNIRAEDESIVDETALTGHPRTFYPKCPLSTAGVYKVPEALCYNKGFEKSVSEKYNFEVPDVPAIKNDFTNRIAYSDIHVNDAFKNGFRVFQLTHYRDYPKTYGSITKLIELGGNLLCVFEHGVALIPVNERALAGEGSGGNVYVNTSNVLPENPKILSDTFGSQWRESIIKTPQGIYGVDTIGKKIWRTNGQNFECISDFKIQEFLNNNISLTERELEPIIGIRNVKAHYNKFKYDVMFTFYDNLYGFEEKVWNLCWNEAKEKWITFYSWVPSYSENIYNQYFSFDRNTSKWIAKLGISKKGNNFSDGICLTENIIPNDAQIGYKIGKLSLENRTLPSGTGITVETSYELVRDTFGNWKKFGIIEENGEYYLYLKKNATELCSELFIRGNEEIKLDNPKSIEPINKENTESQNELWLNNCVLNSKYSIIKDDQGRRQNLDPDNRINPDKIVTLLNIKANIKVTYNGINPTLAEAYTTGFTNGTKVDAGYYQSTIAVIPKYNMQFLTTDFWKHGQAGIIDIADKIYPTYWYGKQHPFEFEFVVADNPQAHKIFDNLEIISNYAEPESFHYEIIGDCYEFAKDKKNMYIRQEATKEFYQYNGSDILFNSDYVNLDSEHRQRYNIQSGQKIMLSGYDKSTLFPLYYNRKDSFNEIEDYYYLKDGSSQFKNFSQLAGAEIVKYNTEYRIWNHAKAVNIQDSGGRMRGNMHYKEDKWDVQINPINLVQKNEPEWDQNDLIGGRTLDVNKIPIEIGQNPIPDVVLQKENLTYPDDFPKESKDRAIVRWNWKESQNREVKPKDKWIKIRIRYKGDKLAVITAIKTLYSISYA